VALAFTINGARKSCDTGTNDDHLYAQKSHQAKSNTAKMFAVSM
jgi:hypothetical protein